ncbi:allene oxide cyclase barrel-like domain-containing protein [Serratia sp. NPDC078593]|uniref:allene oxide cyclase barrel-like domain-containing protein n=1 Tax=unclassified Serratia (in: enterobacteria) TaxID=2647522 RepID=UPI0037D94C9D
MEIMQGNNNVLSELIMLANNIRQQLFAGRQSVDIERELKEKEGYHNITIISVVERANITFNAKTESGPNVGDANSHTDQLVDERGQDFGTMTGSGWKIAALTDGSVVSWYHETAETPLGNIETAGIWNSSAIWAGQWQSLFAAGVSGDVMGKIGVRQIYQDIPREKYLTLIVLLPIDQVKSIIKK